MGVEHASKPIEHTDIPCPNCDSGLLSKTDMDFFIFWECTNCDNNFKEPYPPMSHDFEGESASEEVKMIADLNKEDKLKEMKARFQIVGNSLILVSEMQLTRQQKLELWGLLSEKLS